MTTRVLSQQARELYRAAYPIGPTLGSTTFAAWMKTTAMPAREIAAKLGCTELSVRSWASGRRVPTIELARRIEALTSIPIAAWVQVLGEPDQLDRERSNRVTAARARLQGREPTKESR